MSAPLLEVAAATEAELDGDEEEEVLVVDVGVEVAMPDEDGDAGAVSIVYPSLPLGKSEIVDGRRDGSDDSDRMP